MPVGLSQAIAVEVARGLAVFGNRTRWGTGPEGGQRALTAFVTETGDKGLRLYLHEYVIAG